MIKIPFIVVTTLLISFLQPLCGFSQQVVRKLTLEKAIEIAKEKSLDAINAKQEFRANYWQYRSYRGTNLPFISLDGTIPSIYRSITRDISPEGVERYISQQYAGYGAGLSVKQNIWFTGGNISLNSTLERVDNFFLTDSSTTSYSSIPINIVYTQPLFQFNDLKWQRRIEPLMYDEAKKKYLEKVEMVNIQATNAFFELLQAQIQEKIALFNLANSDSMYLLGKGRYEFGKLLESDLLNLQLNYLKAKAEVENAALRLDDARYKFRSFLRITDTLQIELEPPATINFFNVEPDKAVEVAFKFSSKILEFSRRKLEKEKEVNRAKLSDRFDAELSAVFGYNQYSGTIGGAYKNPLDQEKLMLNLNIPIYDWGVARGKIKMAESELDIEQNSIEQEKIDFAQSVRLKSMEFNMQKNQMSIAAISDKVARKTYELTKGRYMIGKDVSILDLNNVQNNKDNSEKEYYSVMRNFWVTYFELRRMTLYDFLKDEPLQFNFEDIRL